MTMVPFTYRFLALRLRLAFTKRRFERIEAAAYQQHLLDSADDINNNDALDELLLTIGGTFLFGLGQQIDGIEKGKDITTQQALPCVREKMHLHQCFVVFLDGFLERKKDDTRCYRNSKVTKKKHKNRTIWTTRHPSQRMTATHRRRLLPLYFICSLPCRHCQIKVDLQFLPSQPSNTTTTCIQQEDSEEKMYVYYPCSIDEKNQRLESSDSLLTLPVFQWVWCCMIFGLCRICCCSWIIKPQKAHAQKQQQQHHEQQTQESSFKSCRRNNIVHTSPPPHHSVHFNSTQMSSDSWSLFFLYMCCSWLYVWWGRGWGELMNGLRRTPQRRLALGRERSYKLPTAKGAAVARL